MLTKSSIRTIENTYRIVHLFMKPLWRINEVSIPALRVERRKRKEIMLLFYVSNEMKIRVLVNLHYRGMEQNFERLKV